MKHVNVALFVVHKGCPHTCSFCNQRTITGYQKELSPDDVHSAVKVAMASLDSETAAGGEIAFFGGSFTMVDRDYMISLLEAAYTYIREGCFSGIRISTRPDGITEEICGILKKYGVTAVELGAQSLDDTVLELNERGHTEKQTRDAVYMLKSHGFETGLQMMTGLYGSDDDDSIATAKKIIALHPETVRIYPTVVLEGTRLCELMRNGSFTPKGVEESVELCSKLIPMFENEGIKVIRVGLHSGGDVESGFVGGAYHPAFRELCEGRIYRDAAFRELIKYPRGSYTLAVGRGNRSRMTGQRKANLEFFRDRGYICTVAEEDGIEKYEVRIR